MTCIKEDGTAKDIAAASVLKFYFQDPDGNKHEVVPSFYTDGTDGILDYYTIEDEIDEPGQWYVQGFAVTPDGQFHSEILSFSVATSLKP